MAYLLTVHRNRITITSRRPVFHYKPREFSGHALSFLTLDHFKADEAALVKSNRPSKAGLNRSRCFVHVISPEAERSLEPKSVASGQSAGQQTQRMPGYQQAIPEVPRVARCAEDLEAIFSCITGSRHPAIATIDQNP